MKLWPSLFDPAGGVSLLCNNTLNSLLDAILSIQLMDHYLNHLGCKCRLVYWKKIMFTLFQCKYPYKQHSPDNVIKTTERLSALLNRAAVLGGVKASNDNYPLLILAMQGFFLYQNCIMELRFCFCQRLQIYAVLELFSSQPSHLDAKRKPFLGYKHSLFISLVSKILPDEIKS